MLFYLISTTTTILGDVDNNCSFVGEESETERQSTLFKETQLGCKQWSSTYPLNLRIILCLFLWVLQSGSGDNLSQAEI